MAKIRKHALIVASAGRTGTAFLGRHLSTFVSDCWSAHEPDVWVDETRPASLVAESNYQWYGALPLLGQVFEGYRVLAVTRDPRTWLRSRINFGAHHDARDRVARFGLPRISPRMLGDEPRAREWAGMDTFQRVCWDWNHVAVRLLKAAASDPAVVLVWFEGLFLSAHRRENMAAALRAATTFPSTEFRVEVPAKVLANRTNTSTPDRTRGWEEWTEAQRLHLLRTCGETMGRLGHEV